MIEQCKRCKRKETLHGGIVGCPFMDADCKKGEKFEPHTNADRIRAMSDEELARRLHMFVGLDDKISFCPSLPECDALLDTEDGIPEEKCIGCLLAWLQKPAEEEMECLQG